MKIKCVFRDSIGFVRIVDLEAGSVEESLVGLHDKCRESIKAVESVDKSTLMIFLEYLVDPDGEHYRILYRNDDIQEDAIDLAEVVGDEKVVFIDEPPVKIFEENQQGVKA